MKNGPQLGDTLSHASLAFIQSSCLSQHFGGFNIFQQHPSFPSGAVRHPESTEHAVSPRGAGRSRREPVPDQGHGYHHGPALPTQAWSGEGKGQALQATQEVPLHRVRLPEEGLQLQRRQRGGPLGPQGTSAPRQDFKDAAIESPPAPA